MTYLERKQARKEHYEKHVHGKKMKTCTACSGSGYYDHNGTYGKSSDCGACGGKGKVKEQ